MDSIFLLSPVRKRTLLAFAVALLVRGGLISISAATSAATAPPAKDLNSSPWGVTSSASSSRVCSEWLPKMSAAGVVWCRMFPDWGTLEPAPGRWNLDAGNKMIATAETDKIQLSGLFLYSAQWARPAGATGSAFPMDHLNDWSEYVGKVVQQYQDKVHYWEIWNEPNGAFKGHYGKDRWDTTTDYATLVADAYTAAKQSDPGAKIGISVASFDAAYIDQVVLAEAKMGKPESFDYFCIHPYETIGGLSEADGEIPYLWMAKMLRDEIKTDAPDRPNPEIWITEVGRHLGTKKESTEPDSVREIDAAVTLVKAYIMAMTQGIQHICWFEAQDPHGEPPGYGLLRIDGTPRPSYTALKTMIVRLGETPRSLGWLALGRGGRGYGFVFQGATGPVLVAWMPLGETDNSVQFSSDVKVVDAVTNAVTPLKAGWPLKLTDSPILIVGLPNDWVAEAQHHAAQNFPWGGDYSASSSVSIQLGSPNINKGIIQVERTWTTPDKFADGSTGMLLSQPAKHDAQNIKFVIHPSFANLKTHEYYIRVTARRKTADTLCGMNLIYEMADTKGGWPMQTAVWFGLSNDTTHWQTYTWHVTDACFAKMWGYDFAFAIGKSDPFVIGKVEVSSHPFND